jgi:hypothetical protein
VDEANFEIRNKEKIRLQLSTAQSLASESYTVHPPAIKEDLFAKLPLESREKIIDSYADIFAEAIIRAIKDGSEFSVAVENMTAKGEEGSWGQKVDDILILIRKIEQKVAEKGVDSDAIKNHVGATLDIDHALRGATLDNFMQILESWFKELGDYLKVVHLFGSSDADEKFIGKHKITLDFVSKFNPNARLFIESKQDPEITKELYTAAKEVV